MEKQKDILESQEINKDIVFAQLRNLVDPLFLSNDILKHVEKYFPIDEAAGKIKDGTITRNAISDFVIVFARTLREDIKSSGRAVIESDDVDAAYTKVKERSPF